MVVMSAGPINNILGWFISKILLPLKAVFMSTVPLIHDFNYPACDMCLPHLYFKCSVYDIWLCCFYNATGILFENKAFLLLFMMIFVREK